MWVGEARLVRRGFIVLVRGGKCGYRRNRDRQADLGKSGGKPSALQIDSRGSVSLKLKPRINPPDNIMSIGEAFIDEELDRAGAAHTRFTVNENFRIESHFFELWDH